MTSSFNSANIAETRQTLQSWSGSATLTATAALQRGTVLHMIRGAEGGVATCCLMSRDYYKSFHAVLAGADLSTLDVVHNIIK